MSFINISPEFSTGFVKIAIFFNKAPVYKCPIQAKLLAVRSGRIELPPAPWQGAVLPLNYDRKNILDPKDNIIFLHFVGY